ncbi:hypothetical protein LTR56_000041 [Elasticomyces elasticus]|nr:hypothetical protein LTR22_016392 [Elasticomyces elasticus]KAK3661555.1 hypothetical protein LTR56_000041 [Elasticomyces elasticus]KAK4932806.1 hypothetical protein LTR49_000760 [Elasticomyces elasticus]KAK5739233.1 hypothetical protein LTS12_025335 [Elasticomyces elasticus]
MKATMNYTDWRQLWYRGRDKEYLWWKWNNNREAFFASYGQREETITRNIERGMELFTKLSKIDMRAWEISQARAERHQAAGLAASNAFINALSTGIMTADADFVFLAIDFEGDLSNGVNEFGFAKLDTRDIIGNASTSAANVISGHNYAFSKDRVHGFMFGDTTRVVEALPAAIIKDALHIPQSSSYPDIDGRKIVLVGHAIHNELRIMEGHGINIDDLPTVIGTLDTPRTFGRGISLEDLLVSLGLPLPRNSVGTAVSFHNAGNDAHYTLRALLALLYKRHQPDSPAADCLEILNQMATAPLPAWPPKWHHGPTKRKANEDYDDSEGFLEMIVLDD